MFSNEQLRGEALRRFTVQVPAGQKLFTQNDKGNTLYIVVEGCIKLLHKVAQNERIIATLGPGEIVGEKALCSSTPYRRTFTAVAETETTVIEFDGANLKAISAKLPEFPIKLLEVVVQRLDKTNDLIAVLQLPDKAERVAQYLLYLVRHLGKKTATGTEFDINVPDTATTLNMAAGDIESVINELVAEKILSPRNKGYVVTDENALMEHLPALRDSVAA